MQHFEPPPDHYPPAPVPGTGEPSGLAALHRMLGGNVSLLLYGPYFSPDNDWSDQFEWIPQGAEYVLPAPQDSYRFYSAIMDFGVARGMSNYENDFMSCLSYTDRFRTTIGAGRAWLIGQSRAAQERGIGIQYCGLRRTYDGRCARRICTRPPSRAHALLF